jgi:hypothetical protein
MSETTDKSKKNKQPLSKAEIKSMSKFKAQEILKKQNPDLINKIEKEVAEQADALKKKIMLTGFVLMAIVVAFIVYVNK